MPDSTAHSAPLLEEAPPLDKAPEIAAAPGVFPVALALAYDGSPFQGWQIQPHGPTVQGRLEEALAVVCRRPVRVTGSGRTDTGVHALNQIAHAHLPVPLDLWRLRQQLNGLAGPHIVVRQIVPVDIAFHARHSARGKIYRYLIQNRPYPSAFARQRNWWLRAPLDVSAMGAAAAHLLGEHDFSAFRAKDCEALSPVRRMWRIDLAQGEQEDSTLRIELEASGFLQHMARIIVGTLVAVGQGRATPDEVAGILAARQRERAYATAPAQGLHMVNVRYDLAQFPELQALGVMAPLA
jgi:tRNA pseudouridine38-40 synthase